MQNPYQNQSCKGFTLFEWSLVLLLCSIIIFIGFPNLQKFLMRQERTLALDTLETLIELAKQEARHRQKKVSLCISLDQKTCFAGWGQHFLLFENDENLAHPKPGTLIETYSGIQYGKLNFIPWGNNANLLTIHPDGMTYNNGSFTYCPQNRDPQEADGLILNNATRPYRPTERNVFGILLKSEGSANATPFSCF